MLDRVTEDRREQRAEMVQRAPREFRKSLLAIVIALACCQSAFAQLDDILKKADARLNERDTSSLSDNKIVAGLKQALQVSTSKAVAATAGLTDF